MSDENVQIVQRAYDLVTQETSRRWLRSSARRLNCRENVLAPDGADYHGPEGLRKWLDARAAACKSHNHFGGE